jgi:coenzyme PQQ synthesis protein D (PqqD)
MDATRRYERTDQQCSTLLDEELVMLDLEQGKYYSLSKTARAIWEALEEPRSAGEVAAVLVTQFVVPLERCTEETATFMERLADRGLIRPSPQPG